MPLRSKCTSLYAKRTIGQPLPSPLKLKDTRQSELSSKAFLACVNKVLSVKIALRSFRICGPIKKNRTVEIKYIVIIANNSLYKICICTISFYFIKGLICKIFNIWSMGSHRITLNNELFRIHGLKSKIF